MKWLPGIALAAAAAVLSWGIHALIPATPLLTAAVALGIIVAQIPALRPALAGPLKPGLGWRPRSSCASASCCSG